MQKTVCEDTVSLQGKENVFQTITEFIKWKKTRVCLSKKFKENNIFSRINKSCNFNRFNFQLVISLRSHETLSLIFSCQNAKYLVENQLFKNKFQAHWHGFEY